MESVHLAAQGGHVGIIDALVTEYGVDPNSKVCQLKYKHIAMCIYVCMSI